MAAMKKAMKKTAMKKTATKKAPAALLPVPKSKNKPKPTKSLDLVASELKNGGRGFKLTGCVSMKLSLGPEDQVRPAVFATIQSKWTRVYKRLRLPASFYDVTDY